MKKILVVDNNKLILEFMSDLLEKEGHQVLTAEDGLAALDILKTSIPDVIFIDLIMPNIDGKKLCQIIKSMPRFKNSYRVILSAVTADEETNLAELGADAYIAKGKLDEVAQNVFTVLGQSERRPSEGLKEKVIGFENLYPREVTRELLSSKRHFETILESMAEGLLEITSEKKVVYVNPAALSLIGMPEANLLGRKFIELFNEADQKRIEELQEKMGAEAQTITEEAPLNLNGKQVSLNIIPLKGGKEGSIIILNDITERKQAEESLANSEKKLSQIVQGSPIPTFVIDKKHTIQQWNKACERLTGIKEDEMTGTKKQWMAFYSTERRVMADLIVDNAPEEEIERYYQGKYSKFSIVEGSCEAEDFFPELGKEGKWIFFTASPLRDVDGKITGAIEALQDITERKQAEERLKKAKEAIDAANLKLEEANRELERLTLVDGLTDIANRRHFNQVIADEWRRALRSKNILSLVMVDIDYFKNYNDYYGHQAGDDCLRKVAKMLNKVAKRPGDLVTRYGGEEFAIILSDTDSKSASNLAEETRNDVFSLKIPHCQSDICEYVTISLGTASTVPASPDSSYQSLIEAADNCLYQAKHKGRNQVQALNGMNK